MIHSVKLIRFKQFRETEIQLRPFSILMGENNSGKTTVLQAVWLALRGLHQGRLLQPDKRTGKMKPSKTGFYMFNTPFVSQRNLSSLFYNKVARKGMAYDEESGAIVELTDDRDNCFRVHMRELFENLNFKLLDSERDFHNPDLQHYSPLYISGFAGPKFEEERLFPAVIETRVEEGSINSILRNIILDLKMYSPRKYQYLDELLKREFAFHIEDIHFDESGDQYVFSEYVESRRDSRVGFDLNNSGSGIMQILQTISAILRYCPEKTKVVLIDEPDVHLHNNLQVRFFNILMKMQRELGIQMIISTHSTAMIQNADPADVIPILSNAKVNRGLTCGAEVQQAIADRLDAYELGKAKISGKIAFFEDSNLEVYEKMAYVLKIDSFSGVNTIPVIRGRGKDDKLPFTLSPVLREILGREIEIHVIRDSDGMPMETREKLMEYARRHNVKLHILSRYEIENYILDPELICRTLRNEAKNDGKTLPTVSEVRDKINEELLQTIRGGIYKYSIILNEILYKIKRNLLGDRDYTSDSASHEMEAVYREYYEVSDPKELLRIGMGKQACANIFRWLNEERGLQISKKSMLLNLQPEEVCEEIKELLNDLRSNTDFCDFPMGEQGRETVRQEEEYVQLSFMEF